ncbi:MAG: ABC transporter substrate-binding protein [Candidatus Sumerlaeota bacterium]|nr:ABC transporter substrate-binding protein [Candidatus Sumerlaeota bacterium]
MAATLMACGGGAKKKIKVGFAETGAESAWRTAHTQSIKAEAEKRGAIDLKFADGQGKQENQIKALRSFIAQQCDVIILSPLVETGWEPVLKEAKKAKIPVLLLDRRIKVDDDSLYVSFIGSDFVQEGKMVGEWLKKKMNGKAKIVELEGTPGSAPAIDRKKGFLEVIKDSPDMKVIASQSGDFRRSNGKEVMEALLKKYGAEIEVVFAHNDDMALGAIQAIEEAGKKPGKDIIVVSIDAIKDAFQAMIDGKLNCSVECNPLQGPAAFDAVEKIMKGETMPKTIIIKDECYDQSVAKATIASRKY